MSDEPKVELTAENLHRFELFHGLDGPALQPVMSLLTTSVLPSGTQVFVDGEFAQGLALLAHGHVEVRKELAGKGSVCLTTLTAPAVLGEVELLEEAPAAASVVTTEPCQIWWLSNDGFDKLVHDSGRVAALITRRIGVVLSRRLAATNELLAKFAPPPEAQVDSKRAEIGTRWRFE